MDPGVPGGETRRPNGCDTASRRDPTGDISSELEWHRERAANAERLALGYKIVIEVMLRDRHKLDDEYRGMLERMVSHWNPKLAVSYGIQP